MAFHPRLFAALLVLLPAPALAQDMFKPLQDFVEDLVPRTKPAPRPAPVAKTAAETPPPLPKPRPEGLGEDVAKPVPEEPAAPAEDPAPPAEETTSQPEEAKPAPEPEADTRIYQVACPAMISGAVVAKMLPPIAEGVCMAQSPLEVTALTLNGRTVELTSPIATNCEMATALVDWAGEVDAYARAALDSEIAALQTGTSYMCRPRVGGGEAFTSEHGFANAVDVVGFTLADGRTVVVKDDWTPATTPEAKLLRQSHGAACGRFTTVLGPEANADHEDHLHLDLGCHGQTCTAQLCE
ncbi:extensin family protein [Devosia sp.]|uniref:extensin-like domain-containing protein n=1 Tax=Devosia sp. TaxID=1871048 RepID=UPI001AD4A69C|nr:extensin family protein [Devosia sp.]MBN9334563.1 extensin family protein [Devosia sp.]